MERIIIRLLICLALSLNIYSMEESKEICFPFEDITEELKPHILKMGMDSLVKSSSTINEVFDRATSHIKAICLTNNFFKSQHKHLIKQCRKSLREKFGPEIPTSEEELLKLLVKDDEAFVEYILLGFDTNYCFKNRAKKCGYKKSKSKPLIFFALKKKNITLIKLLIMFGVNIDQAEAVEFVDSSEIFDLYHTPLIFCAKKGYEDIGMLLIRHGAKIDVKDFCGQTALSLADKKKLLNLREMLMADTAEYDKILQYTLASKTKVDTASTIKKCHNCGVSPSQENALLRCGKCRKVYYCNTECQKKDWPKHKSICGK